MGAETAEDVHGIWPDWLIRQGYGKVEAYPANDQSTNYW